MQNSDNERVLRELIYSVRRPRQLRWLKVLQCIGRHPSLTANTLSIKLCDSTQNIHPFLKLSLDTTPPIAKRQKSNEAVDRLGRQKPEYLYSLAEWVVLAEIEKMIEEMEDSSETALLDLTTTDSAATSPDPAQKHTNTDSEVEMAENLDWFEVSKVLAKELKTLTKDLTGLKSIVSEMGSRVAALEAPPTSSRSSKVDEILEFLKSDSE
jgi:hypothetical protein